MSGEAAGVIGVVLPIGLEVEKRLVVGMVRKNGVYEWNGMRMKKVGVKRVLNRRVMEE